MLTDMHYAAGMRARMTELGQAMTAGRYWRWTAWGLGSLLAVSILGNIVLGAQPKWKPYYVEIDT